MSSGYVGKRPLNRQDARAARLPGTRIRKAGTTINVQMVDSQEVFRQHADRIVNPVYGMSLNETFPLRVLPASLDIPIQRKFRQHAAALGVRANTGMAHASPSV